MLNDAAENPACLAAMGALEYFLIFREGCLKHHFQLRRVNELKASLPSALVVDAKAVYDSLKAETPSHFETLMPTTPSSGTSVMNWNEKMMNWRRK